MQTSHCYAWVHADISFVVVALLAVVSACGPSDRDGAVLDAVHAGPTDTTPTDTAGEPAPDTGPISKPDAVGPTWPPCGLRPSGEYLGCDVELGPGWRSTLCDEAAGRCVAPEASCADGWCYIPPRSYLSGAGPDRTSYGYGAQDAAITVVPRGFYVAETELSLGEFVQLMGYEPSDTSTCGSDCPAAGMSIFEVMEAANRKSDADGLDRCYILEGCAIETFVAPVLLTEHTAWTCDLATFAGVECSGYRLPSRAEWELAAGAGSPYCLPRGPTDPEAVSEFECDLVPELAEWSIYCGNADGGHRPCIAEHTYAVPGHGDIDVCTGLVPSRSTNPNAFGLYEVLGNVWELTQTESTWHDGDPVSERDSEAPFALNKEEEYISLVTREDRVHLVGGSKDTRIPGSCRWTLDIYVLRASLIYHQSVGARLVRTAPEWTSTGAAPR